MDNFSRRIQGWWARYRDNAVALATILGLLIAATPLLGGPVLAESAREWIYAIALVFIVFALWGRVYLMGREARYAPAISFIRQAVSKIAEETQAQHHTHTEKIGILCNVMDDLSNAFSIVTGTNCRSCIKMIVGKDANEGYPTHFAETLCRNTNYQGEELVHAIRDNTGFRIFVKEPYRNWFFGNNLFRMQSQGKYTNTTPNWQARYRSAIIWPLRWQSPGAAEKSIGAYLCIDSMQTNPFREDLDYPLGAVVADAATLIVREISIHLHEDELPEDEGA